MRESFSASIEGRPRQRRRPTLQDARRPAARLVAIRVLEQTFQLLNQRGTFSFSKVSPHGRLLLLVRLFPRTTTQPHAIPSNATIPNGSASVTDDHRTRMSIQNLSQNSPIFGRRRLLVDPKRFVVVFADLLFRAGADDCQVGSKLSFCKLQRVQEQIRPLCRRRAAHEDNVFVSRVTPGIYRKDPVVIGDCRSKRVSLIPSATAWLIATLVTDRKAARLIRLFHADAATRVF